MEILRTHIHGALRVAIAVGIVVSVLIFPHQVSGQVEEYRLKAAFLFNFAKFVEWPPEAFATPDEPITICVLGKNPFGSVLNETINGKAVGGRPLVVRQLAGPQTLAGCPILFVTAAESKRFYAVAGGLKGAGVLSVGEADGFAADGGVINFKLQQGSIRLEINADAAERARVHISSKLLSLAQIVRRPA